MRFVDDNLPRRSSFTHFLSPTHHHDHTLRKRAQSLHAQSTRRNSILLDGNYRSNQETQTPDRKTTLKLSISAPLPSSCPSRLRHTPDSDSAPWMTPRTSFIDTRHREDPPSTSERRVQFVEPCSSPDRNHVHTPLREATRSKRITTTKKRTVARVSISTGQLYYIEEPIPEYPFPSTSFSPPPASHHSHSRSLSSLPFRRTSHHIPNRRTRDFTSSHSDCDDSGGQSGASMSSGDSGNSNLPLYTSTSEKLHAHWGTFTFNMRFSMFRAQDRMKDGVAWMGGVVRRIKTGRQS